MTLIVGYGSFMIPESLAKTIKEKAYIPVWVKEHKRVFNLKSMLLKHYHIKGLTNEVAILNAEQSEGFKFNAVVFDAEADEIEKLKIREKTYYTKEVPVFDFVTDVLLGNAIIFIGKKLFHGERIVSDEYLPIPSYLERVREASYRIGAAFGKAFDETTFFGNGMNVKEYLAVPKRAGE